MWMHCGIGAIARASSGDRRGQDPHPGSVTAVGGMGSPFIRVLGQFPTQSGARVAGRIRVALIGR